ncbi:MAG: lysophospholipid acyltransferase family protein [Bacteroidales bacterium]|nr:lysophospholipid acyltransferase family protein [Bacteroidales bacterium]
MKQKICKWILACMGWKTGRIEPDIPKCVICVAPHTSNWDFIIGKLFYTSLGRFAHFLIKKEWFFFPLNYLFESMGGVPVDRKKKGSLTDAMAEEFGKRERFQLAITPEGTRKKVEKWKKGFYHIALKAQVPIMLVYIDYAKKEAGYFKTFIPTGNEEADIAYIKSLYEHVQPRHTERF